MVEPPPEKLTPELVFREYAPRIYHVAWHMLGNDADAEDVTQDVLLQVVRKLDTFRGDAQISTWLHRVTVNAALAHRQKRANRQKREAGEATDDVLETAAPETAVKRWNVAPDDPVLAARIEAVKARGGNAFAELQLPQAVLSLKQGAGRLIRDESDRGVLMLCDPRLVSKSYGRQILKSLPPMKLTRDLDEARGFFAAHPQCESG